MSKTKQQLSHLTICSSLFPFIIGLVYLKDPFGVMLAYCIYFSKPVQVMIGIYAQISAMLSQSLEVTLTWPK